MVGTRGRWTESLGCGRLERGRRAESQLPSRRGRRRPAGSGPVTRWATRRGSVPLPRVVRQSVVHLHRIRPRPHPGGSWPPQRPHHLHPERLRPHRRGRLPARDHDPARARGRLRSHHRRTRGHGVAEFYTGDSRPVSVDPAGYEALLARARDHACCPNPPFDPTLGGGSLAGSIFNMRCNLEVRDVPASIGFYATALGLQPRTTMGDPPTFALAGESGAGRSDSPPATRQPWPRSSPVTSKYPM